MTETRVATVNGEGAQKWKVAWKNDEGENRRRKQRNEEISEVPNGGSKSNDKLFSFVKWETDAAHCNLNRALAPFNAPLDSSILLQRLTWLAHTNPQLRILELGNGNHEMTRMVFNALKSQYGERLYSTYTYAATSLEATTRVKIAFRDTRDINVVFFDVERQLQGQILQAGAYDLIITSGLFSLAGNIKTSVNHLKNLLQPLGNVLLLDTLPQWSSPNGGKPEDDGLMQEVHATLIQSGFGFGSGDDASPMDSKVFAELKRPLKHPKQISLIIPESHHPFVDAVQTSFQDRGIICNKCTLEGDIPQGQDIVSLVDFGEPYLYNITEAQFRKFANRLSSFKGSMIWVIPSAQISCKNPNTAMILGLTRTLRAELRKDITVVEIDVDASPYDSSSKSLLKIYQDLGHRPKAKDVDPDYEYAVVDGDIKIPRLHWTDGDKELANCANQSTANEDNTQSPEASNADSSLPIRFQSDACYLLVGGIGGLGRVIAAWMVENGARSIVFLSRSAKEGPETTPFLDELRSKGCEVSTYAGSVTILSDVEGAVKQMTRPLAGIMQMSAVMRDNWMSQMTFTEWDQCVRPKVEGTWNLHKATSSAKLDFFLLFSSICGLVGQWGQANYNAANSFLDAFVNYRHGQNLPASVVDIGFMRGVGMAVENAALVQKLKSGGYHFLAEHDLLDALTIAIAHSRPGKDRFMNKSQLVLGLRSVKPIGSPSTRVVWKKDARMVMSHQLGSLSITTDDAK